MSFTYDPSTDLGKVRLYLGDTNVSSPALTDEDINALLPTFLSPLTTAIALARALAGKYARSVSFSVEGLSISNSAKADHYLALAESLTKMVGADTDGSPGGIGGVGAVGEAFVGGVSLGEMEAVEADLDRTPSEFAVGKNDDRSTD